MQKIPQVIIYAKQAGVAITPYEKRNEGRPCEGRVLLRFFRLEAGSSALRFIVEPWEAFDLCRKMHKVARDGGKEVLNHRFDSPDGEVLTRLSVERWERHGKNGFALSVQRGEETINVPTAGERFLHAAEFLRHLSVQQAWFEDVQKGD